MFSIPIEVRANWLFRLTDPFASGAYLPGKANLKIMLAFYWLLLLDVTETVTSIEQSALERPGNYAKLMIFTVAAWSFAARRARGARARIPGLNFDEQPEPAIAGLGLSTRN